MTKKQTARAKKPEPTFAEVARDMGGEELMRLPPELRRAVLKEKMRGQLGPLKGLVGRSPLGLAVRLGARVTTSLGAVKDAGGDAAEVLRKATQAENIRRIKEAAAIGDAAIRKQRQDALIYLGAKAFNQVGRAVAIRVSGDKRLEARNRERAAEERELLNASLLDRIKEQLVPGSVFGKKKK